MSVMLRNLVSAKAGLHGRCRGRRSQRAPGVLIRPLSKIPDEMGLALQRLLPPEAYTDRSGSAFHAFGYEVAPPRTNDTHPSGLSQLLREYASTVVQLQDGFVPALPS